MTTKKQPKTTSPTRMSHKDCGHPLTPAERAACRKNRALTAHFHR